MANPQITPSVYTAKAPHPLAETVSVATTVERAMMALSEDERKYIRSLIQGHGGQEIQASLGRIRCLESYVAADEKVMTAILRILSKDLQSDGSSALFHHLRGKQFKTLSTSDQLDLLKLVEKDSRLAEGLGKLVDAKMPDGTARLLNKDRAGMTLLQNLAKLARATFHADVAGAGITPVITARECVQQVLCPNRSIGQGNRGACAGASYQDLLCREQPSEFVRMMHDLFTGITAKSAGGELKIVADSLRATKDKSQNTADLRSHTERVFQSALLDAVSTLGSYSYTGDSATLKLPTALLDPRVGDYIPSAIDLPFGGGMTGAEMKKAGEIIFGIGAYERVTGDGASIHARLTAAQQPGIVCMRWEGGLHASVYSHTESGYVYLKDPNGDGPIDEEGQKKVPRVRAECQERANIKMKSADFERLVTEVHVKKADTLTLPPRPSVWSTISSASVSPSLPTQLGSSPKQLADGVTELSGRTKKTIREINRRSEGILFPALPIIEAAEGTLRGWLSGTSDK